MTQAIECEYSVQGSGPPLFLIHGIGSSRIGWRMMLDDLTPHFKHSILLEAGPIVAQHLVRFIEARNAA